MLIPSQSLTLFLISVRCFDEVLMQNTGEALCLCWGQQRNCCGCDPSLFLLSQLRQPPWASHKRRHQPLHREISARLMETGIQLRGRGAINCIFRNVCFNTYICKATIVPMCHCYITIAQAAGCSQDRQHHIRTDAS